MDAFNEEYAEYGITAVDANIDQYNDLEQSGPFGAKSIGEIVINTPSPALAHAIAHATGVWHRELPITPEKVLWGIKKGQA